MYPGAQQPLPGEPGEILLGKYRVEEVIGVGGMGRVVRATHLYLQQPVAIKILLPQMSESQSTVARFLREAQATVKLRSEHIARVMDVGTLPNGTPFMVMEFLEGHDLNQILRHHGAQLPTAVVDLMLQACEGIAEAHSLGIVHRDIKPSNFFITHRPDGSNLLKILDFGISKLGGEISELTGTQTVIGTPTYMAPEQMQTARSTDPRSDIWSIGVVMYQMLAGRPPFEAEHYAQLVLKVAKDLPTPLNVPLPPGMQSIVFRCLEKDPKDRLQTVGELARQLAPYSSDPLSANQIAERASRILAAPRGSAMSLGANPSAGGGLQMTPPALTPKSWNHTSSSLSAGAGQVGTANISRSKRGFVIAGVATLCIAAGGGGFLIANSMKGGGSESHVTAPTGETQPAADPAPMQATTPAPPPKPSVPQSATQPPPTPDPPKTDATKTDVVKTDTPKTDATKTTATKTVAKTTAKTDATKSTAKTDATKSTAKTDATKTKTTSTKTTTSPHGKDDDLFDNRK